MKVHRQVEFTGLVDQHAKYIVLEGAVFVFAGNTAELNATPQYPDRSRLPDDFRNRFVFIEWGYDVKLERTLTLLANPNAEEWFARVQTVRALVAKTGVPLTVSPRTSVNGAKLLALGMSQKEVEAAVLWQHAPKSIVDRVTGGAE